MGGRRIREEVELVQLLSGPSRLTVLPCDSFGNLQTSGMQLAFTCLLAGKPAVEARRTFDVMFAWSYQLKPLSGMQCQNLKFHERQDAARIAER